MECSFYIIEDIYLKIVTMSGFAFGALGEGMIWKTLIEQSRANLAG